MPKNSPLLKYLLESADNRARLETTTTTKNLFDFHPSQVVLSHTMIFHVCIHIHAVTNITSVHPKAVNLSIYQTEELVFIGSWSQLKADTFESMTEHI